MLSLHNCLEQAAGNPLTAKVPGETMLNPNEKVVSAPIAACKHAIFANSYLLVRDANQAKPEVIVPLDEEVLLTMLKLCLSSGCSGNCVAREQATIGKDSGFSDVLTTSTSSVSNEKAQAAAEKQVEACCSSEAGASAVSKSSDILNWSIASTACASALERAKLHRSSMLAKPVETGNDDDWTDDEAACEEDAERSTLLCVSSTPRRRQAIDAGFERFWQSLPRELHGDGSEAGSANGEVQSQASWVTTGTEDVATEASVSMSEADLATSVATLGELADEPQAVLCSDFSWLYRHKRVRDTLLSIGATQSVLYEIMMRNRYYDECDERERRMIVDTCKVRRAVEKARSGSDRLDRLERNSNGGQGRPVCRYVFSDSEDDETKHDTLATTVRAKRKVGRPRKLACKQPRFDAVQADSAVDMDVCYNVDEQLMQPVSAVQVDAANETPNTPEQKPTRKAKEQAKLCLSILFGRRRKLRLKRNLKEPFSVGLCKLTSSLQFSCTPAQVATPTATEPAALDQSFVIRSRKRKSSSRRRL